MKWTPEAEAAVGKVPFFVRKRVKARIEKEASDSGKIIVTIAEVKATQQRYLSGKTDSEIKGYRVETCFGSGGCPNRANDSDALFHEIEAIFEKEDLRGFLKRHVPGQLKFHHEFGVGIADCPNACSQPQIRDIGIIGAKKPGITDKACTGCGNCVEICKEKAIRLEHLVPTIDDERCLCCGQCISACPSGTIAESEKGFRVLLGGKLGRHPKLAEELPGIFDKDETLAIVGNCIAFYKQNSENGERFASLLMKKIPVTDITQFGERSRKLP